MTELTIILQNEIGTDLGQRSKIEEIFQNIDSNTSKVTMDFANTEFMGRSFAQEYLNQKHKNVTYKIQKMFDTIITLNNKK